MHTAVGNFEIGDLVCTVSGQFAQGVIVGFSDDGHAIIAAGCRHVVVDVDNITFVEE